MRLVNLVADDGSSADPCLLLRFNGVNILLDCGVSFAKPEVGEVRFRGLPLAIPSFEKVDLSTIDVVLISNYLFVLALPAILRRCPSFTARVFCTSPVYHFAKILLEEFSEFEIESQRITLPVDELLGVEQEFGDVRSEFHAEDVQNAILRLESVSFGHRMEVGYPVWATAVSSGCFLGSCCWILEDGKAKVAYCAQMSATSGRYVPPLDIDNLRGCDVMIYPGYVGGRVHPGVRVSENLQRICEEVERTIDAKGIVLIPVHCGGLFLDVLSLLRVHLPLVGKGDTRMYVLSPLSELYISFFGVLSEWLGKSAALSKSKSPLDLCGELTTDKLLRSFPEVTTEFAELCKRPGIVFAEYPSLLFGPCTQLVSTASKILCVEMDSQDFGSDRAVHLPLDIFLSSDEFGALIGEASPGKVLVPVALESESEKDERKRKKVKYSEALSFYERRQPFEMDIENKFEWAEIDRTKLEAIGAPGVSRGGSQALVRVTGEYDSSNHILMELSRVAESETDHGSGRFSIEALAERMRAMSIPCKIMPGGEKESLILSTPGAQVYSSPSTLRLDARDEAKRQMIQSLIIKCSSQSKKR